MKMKEGVILGAILIVLGVGLYAYYDHFIRYEREARELLTEGKLVYERGSRGAINDSIKTFSRIIARYPGTQAESEAYFYIAQAYEHMNLNRLAYLKYIYILKSRPSIDPALNREIAARIARLKMMRRYTEEGIHELLGLLTQSGDRDFRSRVYTELGHTYLQAQDLQKSKRMFDIALTENGDNEEAILGKARACKRLGYEDTAYNLYEYFFRYYGNFSHYAPDIRRSYIEQVYRSGHERFRKGNYSGAISMFKRIILNFPDSGRTENALYWIGESYFAMKNYGAAIKYFNRVLGNDLAGKDADARIKKGYAYFLMKKFDLAAREFQIYINNYPQGRHIETARKWKGMSTQEILYRINNQLIPDTEDDEKSELDKKPELKKKKEKSGDSGSSLDRESEANRATGGRIEKRAAEDSEYENVGEL